MRLSGVPGKLILENGEIFEGEMPAGQNQAIFGEVVFTTGMTGYVESLTDPAYEGQILVFTYPLIGNYGVPDSSCFESEKIQVQAIILNEAVDEKSHFQARQGFVSWIQEHNIPILWGVDTRALRQTLQKEGTQKGVILKHNQTHAPFESFSMQDFLKSKFRPPIRFINPGREKTLIIVDCGLKQSLICQLQAFSGTLKIVPYDYDFSQDAFDALVLSSGPGDPSFWTETIENVKKILPLKKPIFGICLGLQILGLAIGAKMLRLPFGHRGLNHLCLEVSTQKIYVTAQNHGFALDEGSLPEGWIVSFRQVMDGSVAGIAHKVWPYCGVQFHPEGGPGPREVDFFWKKKFFNNEPSEGEGRLFITFPLEGEGRLFITSPPEGEGRLFITSPPEGEGRLFITSPLEGEGRVGGRSILILGSGGFQIGQAGEFDYSGSQAIKALKAEGIKVILINPNMATVQTDLADKWYPDPLNVSAVSEIIAQEKPEGILLGFGGQIALNLGLELEEKGILSRHQVAVLGTPLAGIRCTEDRILFKNLLLSLNLKTPRSDSASSAEEALVVAERIGYPVMLRAGFALGGLGSGKMETPEALRQAVRELLQIVPQVLIEEYLEGWKEFEYEIIRSSQDQALAICVMENMDPLGIHTGDSLVVAPAQTLSDQEHQHLRSIALQLARTVGVVGECNIQFAVNPQNGDYRVIEMNARLSRSSALASKATGYPLAFIAAQLALGHPLPALTEPALDYVVVKIPRWDTHKLKGASRRIASEMKSVGEVMAIGGSFKEALQKAVRMLGFGDLGQVPVDLHRLEEELEFPTDRRVFALYEFFRRGGALVRAQVLSRIDPWFLSQILEIAEAEHHFSLSHLRQAKQYGFSDLTLGKFLRKTEAQIRALRHKQGILPVIKQVDGRNLRYLTYHGSRSDFFPRADAPILILGSGPYAMGSSVEFDWSVVNAARALRERGKRVVMLNCNPETVSSDDDESDRLYFEELSLERIVDIAEWECPASVLLSVGGQIPHNLAIPLSKLGFSILGTSPQSIDLAENREKFSRLLDELGLPQPAWAVVQTKKDAEAFVGKVGYPILFRPSYVLSGTSMAVIWNAAQLEAFLAEKFWTSTTSNWVASQFIESATEFEMDGVAEEGHLLSMAIFEHLEPAGVHSGDATTVFPTQTLSSIVLDEAQANLKILLQHLRIQGPFNVQWMEKNQKVMMIECNVRASRSFPFMSKVTRLNLIDLAVQVWLNQHPKPPLILKNRDGVAVKSPQFSYHRLKGADPLPGVEMASTGEVMGKGKTLLEAFYRSWQASGHTIKYPRILISGGEEDENFVSKLLQLQQSQAYEIVWAKENNVASLEHLKIGLAIILSKKTNAEDPKNFELRRWAVDHYIPLIIHLKLANLIVNLLQNKI